MAIEKIGKTMTIEKKERPKQKKNSMAYSEGMISPAIEFFFCDVMKWVMFMKMVDLWPLKKRKDYGHSKKRKDKKKKKNG